MPKIKGGAREGSAKHTLNYISKGSELSERGTHNVLSDKGNTKEITKEFEANKSNRGDRSYYHDHVSFHPKDREKCSPDMMQDFAQKYVENNYSKQQVFWGVHREKEHIHAHFCISATNLDGKKLHLSNKNLGERDKFVQEFAKDRGLHYLKELELKIDRNKDNSKEIKKNRRDYKYQKEQIKSKIHLVIERPDVLTKEQFEKELTKQGMSLTDRKTGIIIDERKNDSLTRDDQPKASERDQDKGQDRER